MNKEQLLQELSAKVNAGEISREEIMDRLNSSRTQELQPESEDKEATKIFSDFSATRVLYFLGTTIALFGIVSFVAQIWDGIGSFGRIVITLGMGLLTAAIGSILLERQRDDHIGLIFHIIGGVLIPGGAVVALQELIPGTVSPWVVAVTFGVIFGFYLLLNSVHKHYVLTFFAIANGTAFIYLLVDAILEGLQYPHGDIYAYLTMMVGASYLLMARAFRAGRNKVLVDVLESFGSIGVLGAAFSQVFDSVLWQLFYFLIVGGGLFLSIYMSSRKILVISTLFLVAHIFYITSEYFADSLGWPVSLVILGFVFIGLGYASVKINKEYIEEGS